MLLSPKDFPGVEDERDEIKRALENPIASKPLRKIAKSKSNAVILVTDITRHVPDHIIVPLLLEELNQAGIPDQKIKVIIATGTHRPATEEELHEMLGYEVLERVTVINHDANDLDNLIYIGQTKFGNKIWINKIVMQADVKVATGCILPHAIAGYGGGRKSILPGVAGEETIKYNHITLPQIVATPEIGFRLLKGNPIHEDMMEAAQLVGLDFIVNVVWNSKGELAKIVAGNFKRAWIEGVRVAEKMYTIKLQWQADVALTSGGGYPTDINLYQAIRGLQAVIPAVREGGIIILVAKCQEGTGSDELYNWLKEASTPEDVIQRVKEEGVFTIGVNMAYFLCKKILNKYKLILVSELSPRIVSEMMMYPAGSPREAIDKALSMIRSEAATVILNPYGAKVIPLPQIESASVP